jgi:mono/diheme cytochrome c family protein
VKRVGVFFAFFLVAVLAACGRSAEEVALVNESVLTSSAATRAAMPTAPTSEAATAEATAETAAAADAPTGDVARGETLFNTSFNTSAGQWICSNCHSTGTNRLIGPGMAGLAARAGTRVEGETAAQYIIHSITNPNDYIVPADAGGPYPSGLMPANYSDLLSEQDMNDLAAYLLTLQP